MSVSNHAEAPETAAQGLTRGSSSYRRANIALFAAGFATFSSLYSVQPLMPLFSKNFEITPAVSSLSLSVSTGVLAFTLFLAGLMSEAIDRKRLMSASMVASAALSVVAAFAPGWGTLLLARALEGFALGGLSAAALRACVGKAKRRSKAALTHIKPQHLGGPLASLATPAALADALAAAGFSTIVVIERQNHLARLVSSFENRVRLCGNHQ